MRASSAVLRTCDTFASSRLASKPAQDSHFIDLTKKVSRTYFIRCVVGHWSCHTLTSQSTAGTDEIDTGSSKAQGVTWHEGGHGSAFIGRQLAGRRCLSGAAASRRCCQLSAWPQLAQVPDKVARCDQARQADCPRTACNKTTRHY